MVSSLYIHIPFCKQKCLYCDFNSYAGQEQLINPYMTALERELFLAVQRQTITSLNTIYLGGGTPSYVESQVMQHFLRELSTRVLISPDAEITIEMNPCTVTKEKLETYRIAGINRISLGLQTTNDAILKTIGRVHTFADFKRAYELVREAGFENVNVDLMFGLPKQTREDVKRSLSYLVSIAPEHISCYSLILHRPIFQDLPAEEEERGMYQDIIDTLSKAGYEQYEISNFAKKGYESKNNMVYWNQGEYLGIGAGASSYVKGVRFMNEESIALYVQKVMQNERAFEVQEVQNMEDKVREYMMLRLRLLEGVLFEEAEKIFHFQVEKKFEKEMLKLSQLGLLEWQPGEFTRLTRKGLDLANAVWREFI